MKKVRRTFTLSPENINYFTEKAQEHGVYLSTYVDIIMTQLRKKKFSIDTNSNVSLDEDDRNKAKFI